MPMYRYCSDCGMKFRKKSYPHKDCPRCGSLDLWDENIPSNELTLVDEVFDDMFREQYADKIKGG